MFGQVYAGRRVLLTGHTGFKGSWLALWLERLGAQVHGLALAPATSPNHWGMLALDLDQTIADIREYGVLVETMRRARPEIVFHLAAWPLVRASYADPLATWATNVMGTAHVLQACREVGGVQAAVIVTTDKCYENHETPRAYTETDPLGGHDPYSASKAGAELVAQSYRRSFFGSGTPLVATARAGNVIGGGDWSDDRIVPDAARAVAAGAHLEIRSPGAVRPWQHVLDSLSGYLTLGQQLLQARRTAAAAWNFGPREQDSCSVEDLLQGLRHHWPQLHWRLSRQPQPHEAKLLRLDIAKAEAELGWRPVWGLQQAIAATADWYRSWLAGAPLRTHDDLQRYVADARQQELAWARD